MMYLAIHLCVVLCRTQKDGARFDLDLASLDRPSAVKNAEMVSSSRQAGLDLDSSPIVGGGWKSSGVGSKPAGSLALSMMQDASLFSPLPPDQLASSKSPTQQAASSLSPYFSGMGGLCPPASQPYE